MSFIICYFGFTQLRSIRAKLPDILHDESLSCANILCFCETWLSPLDSFPPIHDNHVTLRCDRAFDNHKGGVLISVVQNMQPSDTRLFTFNGIECLVTKVLLSNATYLSIALVYLSPTSSIDIFANLLTTL